MSNVAAKRIGGKEGFLCIDGGRVRCSCYVHYYTILALPTKYTVACLFVKGGNLSGGYFY